MNQWTLTALAYALALNAGCTEGSRKGPSSTIEAGADLPVPPPAEARVVMLGTGTPIADPERSGPAVAIVAGPRAYLVDAGPGIVRRASAAAGGGEPALAVASLDIVFLTHLHSDHTAGLADLMLSPWVLGRNRPMHVYGPPGTAAMVEHLQAAYAEDIAMRTEGLEHADTLGHRVVAHEIGPGVVYEDDNVRISAFEVPHGSWEHAFGYRFDTADRSIVVSGDTGPSDVFVDACNGCDLLVHEVYSTERFRGEPERWQRYHSSFHTSTRELADIASRARPGGLLLYHQLYWGATDDDLIAEMRAAGWTGPLASARDLGVY